MVPGEPDALAAAISAMAEVSKIQTDTMQELKKAVDTLLTAVDALPKAEKDDLNENDRKNIEEESMWEMARDTAKEQEKETVESWKDELNNLLVFAGLFSAVVTAFTVESYAWLQQDPGDASNALLAQLSLQLSMFMITFAGSPPSSAFANSTAPPLSLSDVQLSFSPVSYAVSVNTLWVLSLTLSLISAFFAIAAQQWLRQLHLPPEMPVRRAVQLLEARKDGLKTWQVPSIIALLPLLLQIAVIFFLVGLFLLLRSFNATVATAFGSVAVIGLLAFLVTTVIPLLTSRCPYKTPLVPTVVIVLQCLSYPLAVLSTPLVVSLKIFLWPSIWRWLWDQDYISDLMFFSGRAVRNLYESTLLPYLKNFGRHMFVDMGQFWLTREYQYICPCNEADPHNLDLERSSLIQTFLSTPARRSSKVSQLLNSSQGATLLQVVQDTVIYSLHAFRTGLKWSDLIPLYKLDPKMAPYVRKWLSARHYRLLWQHLQRRDWKRDGEVTLNDSRCLILFHELDNAFPAARPRYAKHLLQICAQQEPSGAGWAVDAVPACLVRDLIVNRGHVPDKDDADALLAFASKVDGKYRSDLYDRDKRRLFLVSTALALIAANKIGAARSAGITSTVNILADALDKESTKESAVSELRWYYRDGSDWAHYFPELMSPARIMNALCEALSDYAASPLLSPSPAHLLHLCRISNSLRAICSEEGYKAKPEMEKAREHLYIFDVRVKDIEVASRKISGTAVESIAAVPEPAEARLQCADTNGNDGCTPMVSSSRDSLNKTSSVYSSPAESAGTAVRTDNTESVEVTKNNGGQDPPGIAAAADHSDSLPSPSAETHTAEKDTDTDIASPAAAGSDPPTSSAQVIPEIYEITTVSASEPREAQIDASSPPAVEGASSSAQSQGSEARTALDMNSVAVEDDAPRNEGNVGVESVSSGENAASSGTTGGE